MPTAGVPLDEHALQFLRKRIQQRDLKLRNLARKCGLGSGQAISRILSGKSRPSIATLQKLARHLDMECRIEVRFDGPSRRSPAARKSKKARADNTRKPTTA